MKCNYGCDKEAIYQFKNKKWCCSKSANCCSENIKKNKKGNLNNKRSGLQVKVYRKRKCNYCNEEKFLIAVKKHENSCYLNPKNKKECPICNKPIKNFSSNKTCSHSCSNTYFRSGENHPFWKGNNISKQYRTICFIHHKKECVICGEDKIIAVHHLDEDKSNNDPENLIPLCPTHHQYWHSRFKYLVEEKVQLYVTNRTVGP